MDKDFFVKQIARIETEFEDFQMNSERASEWFVSLRHWSNDTFEKTVTEVLTKCTTSPKLAHMHLNKIEILSSKNQEEIWKLPDMDD